MMAMVTIGNDSEVGGIEKSDGDSPFTQFDGRGSENHSSDPTKTLFIGSWKWYCTTGNP